MIKLELVGKYQLIETNHQKRILILDQKPQFAWILVPETGKILLSEYTEHMSDVILSRGIYRLYQVLKEAQYTSAVHLELFVGDGTWQGYLLPDGLPKNSDEKYSITSTKEIITKSTH